MTAIAGPSARTRSPETSAIEEAEELALEVGETPQEGADHLARLDMAMPQARGLGGIEGEGTAAALVARPLRHPLEDVEDTEDDRGRSWARVWGE
ncbi:MAG: hypothetical protein IPK72_22620 [Candidatus Eisenbacteria bacterium]|nr:hypothetical protein [Candidatus Eisenbacteria bacterium]